MDPPDLSGPAMGPATALLTRSPREVAGRYVLLDRLGAGGAGTVWRAWDRRREEPVALKELADPDGDALARFLREQALRLDHPHVVTPTGWAAEDETVVLAMELVRGGSTTDLLARHGPLPEGYVAALLLQLLHALAHAHAHGVVHRDVKPANLLLEPTGIGPPYLRLSDFGVAALLDDSRPGPRGAVGTDGYLEPAQARGAPPHPEQDVYAAARVALRLLAGPSGAGWGELRATAPDLARLLPAMVAHRADRPTAAEAADQLCALGVGFRAGGGGAGPPDVPDLLVEHPLPGSPDGEAVRPARRHATPWWSRLPTGAGRWSGSIDSGP